MGIEKPARQSENPGAAPELEAALANDPHSFSFFQAVRLLESLLPDRRPVGGFGHPDDEVARFTVPPSISFPASEIQDLELSDDGPARLAVNFMGLTGPLGVLPFEYTMLVAQRRAERDTSLRDFLDIFHHRFISLFYKAWKKSRVTVSQDEGNGTRYARHLLNLIGNVASAADRDPATSGEALLFYTGLLATRQRSAIGLQQLLEEYFAVPVEIQQFIGAWYPLHQTTQCSLGSETGAASQLGVGAVAGDEVWDQQTRVRIKLGPLSKDQYDQFLPTGSAIKPLRSLTRFYCGDELDFEVQLVLAKDDVPGCVIGEAGDAAAPLGWSTWVRSAPFSRDADEAVFTL